MLPKIIFILLALMLLASCDPGKQIVIKNQSDNPAKVIIVNKNGNPIGISKTDSLCFKLGTTKDEKSGWIFFGFGNWAGNQITEFAHDINYIEIVAHEEYKRISTPAEMVEFLTNRRRGILKNIIKIKVK